MFALTIRKIYEELKALAKMQEAASSEVHHVQHLERSETALSAEIRRLSEEKAALKAARMDVENVGKAMREAIFDISVYVYVYIYIYIYLYAFDYLYMWIYIYIHICTYIYIHIHIFLIREAIASQSEGYVRRVGGLEEPAT